MELDLNNSKNELPSAKIVYSFKHHIKSKSFEKINNKDKLSQHPRLKSINNEQSYKIGNYFIKNTIGSGNFGKVKAGIYIPTGEKVAIKIIEKSKIKEKDDLIRLERELEMLSKFEHPNIIMVSEIFENENNYYIVMDYCEGGELFNYIVKNKFLSEDESSFFYYQLINGLEYIHSLGIVHRDLKPENILLTKDHLLKIIDFGLSNYYKQGQDKLLYTPCGSPCYASPEMINGNYYDGTKIDIWCTGIILFAMLCGFLPFEDKSNTKMFKKIVECKVNYPKYLSETSIDLLKKIIVPYPKDRININEIKKHPFYLKGKCLFDKEFTIFYFGKKLNNHDKDTDINNKYKNSKAKINDMKLSDKDNNQNDNIIEDHIINISIVNDDKEINNKKNNNEVLKHVKKRNIKNINIDSPSFNKTFDIADKKNKTNLANLANKTHLKNNILKLKEMNETVSNIDTTKEFSHKYNFNNVDKIIETRNKKKKLRINSLNIVKMNTNRLNFKNLLTNLNLSSLHKDKNRNIKQIKTLLSKGKSESVEKKPSSLNKFQLKTFNDKYIQKRKNSDNKFFSNFILKILKRSFSLSQSKSRKKPENRGKSSGFNSKRKNKYETGNTFYVKKYTRIKPINIGRIKKESGLKNYYSQINSKNQKDFSKSIDVNDILEKNRKSILLKPLVEKRKLNYFNGMRLTLNSTHINNIINKYIKNKETKNNNLSTEYNYYLSGQNSKDGENFQNVKNNIIKRKQNSELIDKYNLNNFENINDIINKKIKHRPERGKLNFINSENSLNKHKLFISKILRDKFETKINNNNFTQKILIYNNYIYNTTKKNLSKNKKLLDKDNPSIRKYATLTTQTQITSEKKRNKSRKINSKKKYIKVFTKQMTQSREQLKVNRKKVSIDMSKSLLNSEISNNTTLRNTVQNNKKKINISNDSKKIKIRLNKKELNNNNNLNLNNKKNTYRFSNDFNLINYINNKNSIKSKNSRVKNNFFKQNTYDVNLTIENRKITNRENTQENLLNKGLKYIKINNKYFQNNMILNDKKYYNETSKKRKDISNKFCEIDIKSKLTKDKKL